MSDSGGPLSLVLVSVVIGCSVVTMVAVVAGGVGLSVVLMSVSHSEELLGTVPGTEQLNFAVGRYTRENNKQ